MSTFATIDDLRSQLGAKTATSGLSPEYIAKMMHPIPKASEKNRAEFILERVKDKRVLEFGASGPMHDAIVKVAAHVLGVDRDESHGVVGFDLDDVTQIGLPMWTPEVIVCGEVLEHLSNPGYFLSRLRKQYAGVPTIITVPTAFSDSGRKWALKGVENVNKDHVSYYSHRTLQTLLERVGYTITEFHYYNGSNPTAEGLIVVAE